MIKKSAKKISGAKFKKKVKKPRFKVKKSIRKLKNKSRSNFIKKNKLKKVKITKVKSRKKLIKKKPKAKLILNKKAVIKKRTKSKKLAVKKIPSSIKKEKNIDFSPENLFKARIKVMGIGGGGSSIVSEIGRSLGRASFVIADTDSRAFKKRKGIKYFSFGQKLTRGLGTGLNPGLAKTAAEQEKEKISDIIGNQDIVIIIASLGGGVGSGAAPIFAKQASEKNDAINFGIFTLPFKFEGKYKQKIAQKALLELRNYLNVSVTIPNEKIFKVIDSGTAITEAFSVINKNLIESLESLIDLIYNPGVINIDFADLKAILKGKGNLAFFNTATASGKNRLEKITKDILYNPLYRTNNFTAQGILFNVSGGNDLSMFEVDKISNAIAQQNPKAKIIFGISKNSKLKNKIKATILMTGSPVGSFIEKPKENKVKAVKPVIKYDKKIVHRKKREKNKEKLIPSPFFKEKDLKFIDEKVTFENKVPINVSNYQRPNSLKAALPSIQNKTVRRTALEVKKAQDLEEKKQSQQEKEWEIPAFLRFKR